jgi:hypothetical protein
MSGQLPTEIPSSNRLLTAAEFHRLADVPPEVEWFANISNPHTRRAYENAVKDFMHFAGIRRPEEFRAVTRAHIIGWRDDLVLRGLGGSTTRHRLASLASLFEYLCERNAVTHNPVKGVAHRSGRQISGRQAGIAGDRQAPASGAVDPGDGFDYLDDGGNTASAHRASVAPTAEIIPPATWLRPRASQAGTNVAFIGRGLDQRREFLDLARNANVEVLFSGLLLETSFIFARRSLSTTVRRDLALEAPRSSLAHVVALRREQRCDFAADFSCLCR